MITLQKLITIAPFSEDMKKNLLSKVDTLDDSKKIGLINLCWDLLSEWYVNEIDSRRRMALLEMAEGKKTYTKEELAKIPDTVFADFEEQLQEAATQEEIQDVREKLEEVVTNPQLPN